MHALDFSAASSRGLDLLALPQQERRLRIGLVGGGRIAKVHSLAMRTTDRWDIVAGAFSSNPLASAESGKQWSVAKERTYSNYREMAAMEAARPDGIEAVAITTPNDSHYDAACCFIAAGIDVLCEKPLTTTLHDACDLVRRVRQAGVTFAVAHAFAAHAMIRQAKALVQSGELGRIRQVHVEFAQEWMMNTSIAKLRHVLWRQDPNRSGQTACTADIGTHAHHLACFVAGMAMTRLRAELLVCGAQKVLDDTVYVSARYADDVPGLLWASQVAPGNFVGLRLRIFGDEGGLAWDQQNPECLTLSRPGNPAQIFRRGLGSGNDDAAERMTRLSSGNVEGWLEAWSNLYAEFAVAVWARRAGQTLPSGFLQYATVEDGARGMKFINSVVESNASDGSWVDCTLQF